jgi:multisubunit Na+/H+ antiporter MnhB subunit
MNDAADSSILPQKNPYCSECGAANFFGATKCHLCGREFTKAERAALPPPGPLAWSRPPRQPPESLRKSSDQPATIQSTTRGQNTYSLSTLFLIITVVCVFCGLIASAPGLGVPLAVLITPALIRTLVVTRIQRSQGMQATVESKISAFFSSLGVVILVLFAAAAAFFAACSAVGLGLLSSPAFSAGGLVLALIAGTIMALVVGGWILGRTWPTRKKK